MLDVTYIMYKSFFQSLQLIFLLNFKKHFSLHNKLSRLCCSVCGFKMSLKLLKYLLNDITNEKREFYRLKRNFYQLVTHTNFQNFQK